MMRSVTLVCSVLIASTVLAGETKISFRQLTKTYPIAVQRGTSARVEVSSNFTLDGSHGVFFSPSGPKMMYSETEPKPVEWSDPKEEDIGKPYRFQVEVPQDQLPGVYEYRIATNQSVSSVAHLLVTDHPVALEKRGDNGSASVAQAVKLPVALCGVVEDYEDVDCFQISGKKGDEVVAQIFAQRVTRSIHCMAVEYPKLHLMDSMLTLFGPHGQIVAQNDNFYGGDSFLHCRLPADGDYVLEVRDSRYTGDPRYVYCVEITRRPRAFGAFPLAVQRGSASSVHLVASVAEDSFRGPFHGPFSDQTLSQPGWTTARLDANLNPVQVLVSDHRQLQPPGVHTSREKALELQLPVGVSARFDKRGLEHFYRFPALKDRYYRFEVNSQRRGFAVDSVITVFDTEGKKLATGDDGWFTKDAKLDFHAPADGDYFVTVRDLNRRGGRRYAYHLSIEPSGPDFEVHGEYYYGMLSPAGRAIWFVKLKRLNGFNGPVEVRVDGLPKGVSFTSVTIPTGMNHCSLIFTAAHDAPINASLVRVTGHATVDWPDAKHVELVREAHVTCELRRAGASRFYRSPIRTQLLGVTKPLDVTAVIATPASVTLEPGGLTEINVRIHRSPEYKDQVLLDMAFSFFKTKFGEQLPPGVTIDPSSKTKLTGDTLEGTIVLKADTKALSVRDHPVAVLARVPITYSIMTNYASNPVLLTVGSSAKLSVKKSAKPSASVRVADVIDGHVHPSVCVTQSGDILAVYNKSGGGGKELLLCRSRDGGRTWSTPAAIPVIQSCSIYPGSLTTMRDGRIVLHWSCYRSEGKRRWRVPQYCLSENEGKSWSRPRNLPIDDHTNYSCLRHSVLELDKNRWICPLYDRTVVLDLASNTIRPFGDGRNHGMVPIVRTAKGTFVSGAPQANAPVPVGPPGKTVHGLRSTDGGKTWRAINALPYFGVAGYDLTVLDNDWIVLTSIVYGVGVDGEWSYELIVSRDDGKTWSDREAVEVYNPGRRISGRGWPRTVQLDKQTLGTLFYDLDKNQPGGPGLFFVRTPIAALSSQ